MVDQVDIRGTIQRHEQFFDTLANTLKKGAHGGISRSRVCCAGDHDRSSAHVLLLVNAKRFNSRTVKPHWHQRVVGRGDYVIPYFYRCAIRGERVKRQQRQRYAGQRYAQTD